MKQVDQFDIRHCEGLTDLRDMLTIRTACMYEWLRERIAEPEHEISGIMLTAPVLLSFMFEDYNRAKPTFDKCINVYYQNDPIRKKRKYAELMKRLLLFFFL